MLAESTQSKLLLTLATIAALASGGILIHGLATHEHGQSEHGEHSDSGSHHEETIADSAAADGSEQEGAEMAHGHGGHGHESGSADEEYVPAKQAPESAGEPTGESESEPHGEHEHAGAPAGDQPPREPAADLESEPHGEHEHAGEPAQEPASLPDAELADEKEDDQSGEPMTPEASHQHGEHAEPPAETHEHGAPTTTEEVPPGEPGKDYTPVITPDGETLPYKLVDGVKVFHLIAAPVNHELAPGLIARMWGYNGRTPGPTIEVVEGDRVRIYVTNHLPEPTSLHPHGILLPSGMDGVSGLTQEKIVPGATFKYEFTLNQSGTNMYHPHFDEMTQMGMGLQGMFIIHPRGGDRARPDRDFVYMLNEWSIEAGVARPNPMVMNDFNLATLNGKVFPATSPIVAQKGDRVRIRIGNLSATDHHPIHLHGFHFKIVETDAGPADPRYERAETTVLVPVGSTRAIELIANAPGDWAMHCHMTHHLMNQMGHGVHSMIGLDVAPVQRKLDQVLPGTMIMGATGMGEMAAGDHAMHMTMPDNSIPMQGGAGPFGTIDMGGMFTILKVREDLTSTEDPGWYVHPPGTVAAAATPEDLERDGVSAEPGVRGRTPEPPAMKEGGGQQGHGGHHGHSGH